MTQRVFLALLTIGVFAAGYAVRTLTEQGGSVPPPPAVLNREYAPGAGPPVTEKGKRELDRAKLVAEIQKLRPQIDAFSTQVDEIQSEFDREFNALLNPKQLEKRQSYMKRRAERESRRLADRDPLSDEEIQRERERPFDIYWLVTVTPLLDRLTKEYELDAAQQNATRALLALRRNKFIALFDATPHPSIRLSRLAPLLERVAGPAPKTAK